MIVRIVKHADHYELFGPHKEHLATMFGKSTVVDKVLRKIGDEAHFHVLFNRDGTLKSVVAQAGPESFS